MEIKNQRLLVSPFALDQAHLPQRTRVPLVDPPFSFVLSHQVGKQARKILRERSLNNIKRRGRVRDTIWVPSHLQQLQGCCQDLVSQRL